MDIDFSLILVCNNMIYQFGCLKKMLTKFICPAKLWNWFTLNDVNAIFDIELSHILEVTCIRPKIYNGCDSSIFQISNLIFIVRMIAYKYTSISNLIKMEIGLECCVRFRNGSVDYPNF